MAHDRAPQDPVQAALTRAFAPMHKLALGVAVGLTSAVGLFALTAFHIILPSPQAANIALLSQYFYGYQIDWLGAFIGGQQSVEALRAIDQFLETHPSLPADLRRKVLQTRDELERTVRIRQAPVILKERSD